MSALSYQLVSVAVLLYLAAMIGHAVEYALNDSRGQTEANRELVGAAIGAGCGSAQPATGLTSSAQPAAESTGPGNLRIDRGQFAGRFAVGLTMLAALLHVAAVITRGIAADRMPWGNMYEFVLTGSFIGIAGWLAVLWKRPTLRRLGLFLTLVMVLLMAVALLLYVPVGPLMPALRSWWFVIHVSTIVFSSGIFLLGAVPAATYLMRAGYESGRRGFPYDLARRLPAAVTLERLTFGLHAFTFPIFTFAVIAGAIWAEAAWGRPWGWDPKETWSFISWVVYAGYLHARATPSVKRNLVAWIALLGFATMLMNLFGVNMFFQGLHSYAGLD